MTPIFELDGVGFRYPDAPALDGVSFSIAPGQCVALLGANGSGKSTLLRLLAGLAFAQAGRVCFQGRELTEAGLADDAQGLEFRRRVGVVFQNPDAQLFNATVFDEVAFGPLQMGWSREQVLERTGEALRALDIEGLRDRPPYRLSGGEKKRVALASVLVLDPDVLILDEPTAALDPQSQARVIDFLFERLGERTVIIATHSLEVAREIADTCAVLSCGRLAAHGPAESILSDEALLRSTHLLHVHRHRHGTGSAHSHPHLHS
ncbi:MAG: energy-coupling factor ABC transporter ATP-binding protein [Chthoniobacteraceae bacterium]